MDILQIPLGNIILDLENPRHEPYQSQEEVIEYLCKNEYVYALARDIVTVGINPLDIMAVIPNPDAPENDPSYIIAEGNRRLCALKLLEDPQLAPSTERKNFKEISRQWKKIDRISAVIFEDRDAVSGWLERIHGGTQGGIGRKQWNAEQKTRFTGDIKNLMAQQLLDYAQSKNMITAEERNNKLSTVQRFLSNPLFRDALGVDNSKSNEIQRIREVKDFDLILTKFIQDLKENIINTRYDAAEIRGYSHTLRNVDGATATTIPPRPLTELGSEPDKKPTPKPPKPPKPRYLENKPETENLLTGLGNYKLQSLYHSLHKLPIAEHCPLLTIGLWSFVESLTALNKRKDGTDFVSFLSHDKLEKLGLGDRTQTKALKEVLIRLSANGNTSKHDQTAASFNDLQLFNDFEKIHPLIQALASEASKK